MGQSEIKPRLIHTRRGAVIALCLTGYVAALSFRDVLSPAQHKFPWLIDLRFMLPTWAVAGVNLGFCAYLVWIGVAFCRFAQGKECILVAAWLTCGFLGLIKHLVTASAAANIDYVQATGMLVAFFAAVDIFLRMPASGYPRPDNHTSGNT